MMRRMINAMQAQADLASGARAKVRMGLVSSYDPGSYCAKVRIQPDDTETGWLPIASPWVGNGWGLFVPPTIGDMVDVNFQEDDFESGFISLRFYNDSDRPLPVPGGECWLVHKSGAYLKLTNDGKVALNTAVEFDAGNLGAALHTLVTDAFVSLFNSHTHPTPSGQSSAPTQTMDASHLTSILKAN